MGTSSLFLSHWDASTPVCITGDCVKDLKNYHLMGIRFLYSCLHKKQKGAILNHDDCMNGPLQISAFLNAICSFVPFGNSVLIICTEETIYNWHYHLVNYAGYKVSVLSLENADEILQTDELQIIISTADNTSSLRRIKDRELFCVVVDHLDELILKSVVKQCKGQFNVGLTHRNFMKRPDQKRMWMMMNWSNPGVFGKFVDFCSEDDDHIVNLRCPYDQWWQRLTWKFCDSFIPPSDNELKEYRTKLNIWSKRHNIFGTSGSKPDSESRSVKRKLPKLVDIKLEDKEVTKVVSSNSEIDKMEIETVVEDKTTELTSSTDTIIYDDIKQSPVDDIDNDYILSSIISGKTLITQRSSSSTKFGRESSTSCEVLNNENANDVVMSIIGIKPSETSKDQSSSVSRKNDLLSLLYGNDE